MLLHCTFSRLRQALPATAVGLAISLVAGSAWAADGDAPVVGQPLDFLVDVLVDAEERLGAECVEAEVSFGGRRVAPEATRVRVESQRAGRARVRVLTLSAIDASVVGVNLHVGCTARIARRYLLVAEAPTGAAAAAQVLAPAPLAPAATAMPAPAPALAARAAPAPAVVAAAPVPAAAPPEASAPAGDQRVEIKSTVVIDDSRDSIASKLVVTRGDIERHGDTALADVLRRVPGITVSGGQGKGGEVRMRGLGSGYTQILVNGEPAPAGFTLDSLAPSQVERIEVARVGTVDQGGQAIAGSINITLKQAPRPVRREFKLGLGSEGGRPSAAFDAQLGHRDENVSYALGLGLEERRSKSPLTMQQQGTDAAGVPDLERVVQRRTFDKERRLSLTPSVAWQPGARDKLSFDGLLRRSHGSTVSFENRVATLGVPPVNASDDLRRNATATFMQGRLNWKHTLESEATVEAKIATNVLIRETDTVLQYFDAARGLLIDEQIGSETGDRSVTGAGKLRLPYAEGHAVALGWDGEYGTRSEDRTQRQTSPVGRPTIDLDESFDATVSRLALFVQDEWDVSDALSVYAGIRWAGLRTHTDATGAADVVNHSSVWSPVLQALWKPPGTRGDQFRLALSRSYKAPRTRDLIPRRYIAIENTPTTPDEKGNPDLRPELAWGLDLAYERYLPRDGGMFGINVSARQIDNVILDRLSFDGAWLSTRANNGSAQVLGLELESRLQLRTLWATAPAVELRGNVSRNWSRVDAVPGPDNRLDEQVPWALNLGAEWKVDGAPFTLGGSLGLQGGVRARTAPTEFTSSSLKRTLDAYALWRPGRDLQLRLGVVNALHQRFRTTDQHVDAAGGFFQTDTAPTYTNVRLTLEYKL